MILCDLTSKDKYELLFSCIVAISTVAYVVLTWSLVKETRKQRKVLTEPKIHVGLDIHPRAKNIIELYVENIGHGVAYNVQFKFLNDFIFGEHKKKLSELGIFKSGIKVFAPNKYFRTYVTSLLEDTERKLKNPIEIEITYDTNSKKGLNEIFILDFSEYYGLLYLGDKDKMDLLIKSIDDLTNEIKNK
ncbi:MAG: hypothetical protein ABR968_12145 [Bacteroidales bacterium]|jgi:hypothetical protein